MTDLPDISKMSTRDRDKEIALVQGWTKIPLSEEGFTVEELKDNTYWCPPDGGRGFPDPPDYADPALAWGLLMDLVDEFGLYIAMDRVYTRAYGRESMTGSEEVDHVPEWVKSAWIAWKRGEQADA